MANSQAKPGWLGQNWYWLTAALVLLLLASALVIRSALPGRLSVTDEVMAAAKNGAVDNGAWQPVVGRIGWHSMALVPAGCFAMGSTEEQLEEARDSCDRFYGASGCQADFTVEQPAHEVCLTEPYWIGVTPVTNWQYALAKGPATLAYQYSNLGWPRTGINKQQAAAYCNSIGGRLPTEAEWEFAARGPDNLLYPFGNEYDIEKATLRKISPPPLGQKPGGASWVGALDMSGGVSEWVQDWYGPFQVSGQEDPEGPEHGEYGLAKGGNWFAHASYLVRAAYRERLPAATANSTVGVRCVISVGG